MKPYYEHAGISIFHANCFDFVSAFPTPIFDVVIGDPPYGETSLTWDVWHQSWLDLIAPALKPSCSVWIFGSFRMFLEHANEFSGWNLAQEVIWEKQNGSSFHADRFKRVHELVAHFYRGDWASLYKNPVTTPDATARAVRRKKRPAHMGHIEASAYLSHDGGPRLCRSVIYSPNCHGYAEHPTQKPIRLVDILLEYSAAPMSTVFSPFMGSGTDLVAAKKRRLRSIGCEIEEKYCEIAAKRLSQEVLSFEEVTA